MGDLKKVKEQHVLNRGNLCLKEIFSFIGNAAYDTFCPSLMLFSQPSRSAFNLLSPLQSWSHCSLRLGSVLCFLWELFVCPFIFHSMLLSPLLHMSCPSALFYRYLCTCLPFFNFYFLTRLYVSLNGSLHLFGLCIWVNNEHSALLSNICNMFVKWMDEWESGWNWWTRCAPSLWLAVGSPFFLCQSMAANLESPTSLIHSFCINIIFLVCLKATDLERISW